MVCRGIEYGTSLHFTRVNGEWVRGEHPFTSRVSNSKDASPSAREWMIRSI
jgi:hypothetical protein